MGEYREGITNTGGTILLAGGGGRNRK